MLFCGKDIPTRSTCHRRIRVPIEERVFSSFKPEGMNSFVINPLCSAHPTFLLWRLSSVSERGSKTGPDRSSYHTLRQIAHGLFGEALLPFGIPHILQSNSYQPQTAVRKHMNTCKIGNLEAGSLAEISI